MAPRVTLQCGAKLVADGASRTRRIGGGQPSTTRAQKAHEIAPEHLDRLMDKSAPAEEQAIRKRRLLKGPEEFRDVRRDRGER